MRARVGTLHCHATVVQGARKRAQDITFLANNTKETLVTFQKNTKCKLGFILEKKESKHLVVNLHVKDHGRVTMEIGSNVHSYRDLFGWGGAGGFKLTPRE